MTVYYVDYENVHAGIDGVDKLSAADTVRVFYSPKADTMRIAFVEQALAAKARIELISVDVGTPNALDFQLVAWLYSELAKATEEHVIVSNDHGYDAAIRMGARLGLPQVRRVASIAEALGLPPTQLADAPGRRRSSSRRGGQRRRAACAAEGADAQTVDAQAAGAIAATTDETTADQTSGEAPVDENLSAKSMPPSVESPVYADEATSVGSSDVASDPAHAALPTACGGEAPDEQALLGEASAAFDESALEKGASDEGAQGKDISGNGAQESSATPDDAAAPSSKSGRARRRRRSAKAELAKADALSKMTELMERHEIVLLEDQLNVVIKAAQSAANKQEFYRTIIQKLGQKQGLIVYGQVKQLFKEILAAVASQPETEAIPRSEVKAESRSGKDPGKDPGKSSRKDQGKGQASSPSTAGSAQHDPAPAPPASFDGTESVAAMPSEQSASAEPKDVAAGVGASSADSSADIDAEDASSHVLEASDHPENAAGSKASDGVEASFAAVSANASDKPNGKAHARRSKRVKHASNATDGQEA